MDNAARHRTALILFAHGARDPEWANPMRRVRAALHARTPELRVELAFLEFMTPDLAACAAALAVEGFATIVVLPMFIAQGGHLKKDVPLLVERLRADHPDVRFVVAPPVGEAEPMIRAMAGYASDLIDTLGV